MFGFERVRTCGRRQVSCRGYCFGGKAGQLGARRRRGKIISMMLIFAYSITSTSASGLPCTISITCGNSPSVLCAKAAPGSSPVCGSGRVSVHPAPKATKAPPPAARAKPPSTAPYSIEWLRTRPIGSYVLQLFGVRDRVMAVKFIKDRKISGKSAVLVTQHAGAPWYVVVYGYYPDRAAAHAAIPDLISNLPTTQPWARPIASLK